jgi:phosphate:Na+ symporter
MPMPQRLPAQLNNNLTEATMGELDFTMISFGFVAGVVIFLYGVQLLSESLKAVAGDRMKRIISRATANRCLGVLTGAVVTAILDSSSAVSIIVVGLVHARAMSFQQALAVVMGANIGTTVSSLIFALDAVKYGSALLLPGLLLHWLGRSESTRHWGGAILGLGMAFFALHYLEEIARPLRNYEPFIHLMQRMESPVLGILTGAAITAVIQSSSATMGILIVLVGQGSLGLNAAIGIMLGAEIGTCLDVLVATIGRSREAVRVGVFQLCFNFACIAIAGWFIVPLGQIATRIAGDDLKQQLAIAQVIFNVAGVAIFIGWTSLIARIVERMVPESADSSASPPG